MSDDRHDIPEWYIPDGEHVIANEHEREQIEEHGEVKEPLCPHCGEPYEDGGGGSYTHAYTKVEPDFPTDNATWKPGIVCVNGEKRHLNGYGELTGSDMEWML